MSIPSNETGRLHLEIMNMKDVVKDDYSEGWAEDKIEDVVFSI